MFVSDNYFKRMEPRDLDSSSVHPSTPPDSPVESVSSSESEMVNNNKRKRICEDIDEGSQLLKRFQF